MKTKCFMLSLALSIATGYAQWKPAGDKIKTVWAEQVSSQSPLPEYPRPIMERSEWSNLNGEWEYAITSFGDHKPSSFEGKILVPFPIESSLSGVMKRVGNNKELWYERTFTINDKWKDKQILLHFGAVDWKCDVWVNDVKVGNHTGGYTPFSFNITSALQKGTNTVTVKVFDPTDDSFQPRGKQVNNPGSIWYTPVTGIWQTVWLEPVAEKFLENIRVTPDIDRRTLSIEALIPNNASTDLIEVKLFDGKQLVATGKSLAGHKVELMISEPKLWSPTSPFLYDMEVTLLSKGKTVDQVKSYAAMRKYSTNRDESGIVRMQLNNKDIFQFGPLDQGWWPDGLYTAPTDEALHFDVKKTKEFGFNMIRKHIKVEPARWYTHCDREGIIVWQDMPSGDRNPQWQSHNYFNGTELKRSKESEDNYRKEWQEIINCLYSYPCIGVWVPFNEAWGQFKTIEISEWTKELDPSRLVNPASGGNFYPCGDIMDLHNYPGPSMYLYDAQRANVLGEYGGIGLVMKDHLWEPNRNWGYVQFNTSKEATDEYVKYANQLLDMVPRGFTGAVYTQTTDVEIEVNGIMTYDRKVIKLDEARIREVNQKLCNSLNK